MLNYQKKAYIRVWMTGFGILFILGSFLLCYVFPDILTILVGWILWLFISVCFLFLIGMILFQMIAGCLLDYQMSKELDETQFLQYMQRRKMSRNDVLFEEVMNPSQETGVKIVHLRSRLNVHLRTHPILRIYYHLFLDEKFQTHK